MYESDFTDIENKCKKHSSILNNVWFSVYRYWKQMQET